MIKINNLNKKTILIILCCIIATFAVYYIYKPENEEVIFEEENTILKVEEKQEETTEVEETETIIVHITGAVKNPGIIELEKPARIKDAVDKAGGLTEKADILKVNLAYLIEDGIKIHIPTIDEENVEIITENAGKNVISEDNTQVSTQKSKVNINTATQTQLETLPGIGPSIALKIVNYRKENGKFSKIEDIQNVNGIGESKFNKIKEFICVK